MTFFSQYARRRNVWPPRKQVCALFSTKNAQMLIAMQHTLHSKTVKLYWRNAVNDHDRKHHRIQQYDTQWN